MRHAALCLSTLFLFPGRLCASRHSHPLRTLASLSARPRALSGLQAAFQNDKMQTWLGGNAGVCVANATMRYGASCKDPGSAYVAAAYWAVMTITSIGYGDIAATPGNVSEQVVATILMLCGAIGWGLVLGTIVGNLSNLDPERDMFTQIMSELNKMMRREDLPNEMRIRLRECASQGHTQCPHSPTAYTTHCMFSAESTH